MTTVCCTWLPQFALRVIAHQRVDVAREPVVLASTGHAHPVVLDCSDAARTDGVAPGMLVSRALGSCAGLHVLDTDDELVAKAADRFITRLEGLGAAVHPIEPGRVMFQLEPLLLMYGGRDGLLARVHAAFRAPELRIGIGPNPFVAWVAAQHAQGDGHVAIEAEEARRVLADMPLSIIPADDHTLRLLGALGLRTLGEFASIDRAHITDRLGADGVRLHELAAGVDATQLVPRLPVEPVEESIAFTEPVAASDVLGRARAMLIERAVAHPRCVQHAPRAIVVVASLVAPRVDATLPAHRVRRVLRVPTVDAVRIHTAALPALDGIVAPVEELAVRLEEFALREAAQQSLLAMARTALSGGDADEGVDSIDDDRVQAGLRQVQAAVGDDAILQVLELDAGSRMPERHAVLIPRHVAEGAGGDAS